jgi:hypothetical protein
MCGVSAAGITHAFKVGIISISEDGFVNLDHVKTKRYLKKKREKAAEKGKRVATSPMKVRPLRPREYLPQKKKEPTPPKKTKPPSVKVAEKPAPAPPPPPPALVEFRSLSELTESDLLGFSKQDVDKMKVIEQTLKTRLDREHAQGLLVKRQDVKQVFAKIYSVDTNELKSLEDRLTPAICGVFGEPDDSDAALQVRKMLNEEVTKSLKHIKRIINNYLVRTKAGAI